MNRDLRTTIACTIYTRRQQTLHGGSLKSLYWNAWDLMAEWEREMYLSIADEVIGLIQDVRIKDTTRALLDAAKEGLTTPTEPARIDPDRIVPQKEGDTPWRFPLKD